MFTDADRQALRDIQRTSGNTERAVTVTWRGEDPGAYGLDYADGQGPNKTLPNPFLTILARLDQVTAAVQATNDRLTAVEQALGGGQPPTS